MAKIFISFFNAVASEVDPDAMPCFYESFIKGLEKAGNDILVFFDTSWEQRGGSCPRALLSQIKDFNPDLMIFFNNYFYDVTLEFDCPIVIYEVDSFWYYANKEVLRKNPNRFYYLVPQVDSVATICRELGVDRRRVCHLPFFTEIEPEEIPQSTNICFIGSAFSFGKDVSPVIDFMAKNPLSAEVEVYLKCLDVIKKGPYIKKEKLLELFEVSSQKVANSIEIEPLVKYLSCVNRVHLLSEIADLGLDLYGTRAWAADFGYEPFVTMSYKSKKVYSLEHNQKIYNASKIGLNVNHLQATSGFSWRVCDIMASNACLVSEYKPDFEVLFPKIRIPLFNNRYEARELCVKLLKDDLMRNDIVAECHGIIEQKYRFKHLLISLESFLGISLHSNNGIHRVRIIRENIIRENIIRENKMRFPKFRCPNRVKLATYSLLLAANQVLCLDFIFGNRETFRLLRKIEKYKNKIRDDF